MVDRSEHVHRRGAVPGGAHRLTVYGHRPPSVPAPGRTWHGRGGPGGQDRGDPRRQDGLDSATFSRTKTRQIVTDPRTAQGNPTAARYAEVRAATHAPIAAKDRAPANVAQTATATTAANG